MASDKGCFKRNLFLDSSYENSFYFNVINVISSLSITLKSKYIIYQSFNFGIQFVTNFSLIEWNDSAKVWNSEQNIYKQFPLTTISNVGKDYLLGQISFWISLLFYRFPNNLSLKGLVLILLIKDGWKYLLICEMFHPDTLVY